MRKIILSFAMALAAVCPAATVDYEEFPEEVVDSLIYAWNFDTEYPEVNDMQLNLNRGRKDGVNQVGTDVKIAAYREGLEGNSRVQGDGISFSFDVLKVKGEQERVLLSVYTPGGAWTNNCILIRVGRRNTLELVTNTFAGSVQQPHWPRIVIGRIDELTANKKTVTVVYDKKKNTICAYVDGKRLKKTIKLKYGNEPAKKQLSVVTFGAYHCGYGELSHGKFDNLCFWREALTDEQVAALVKSSLPEWFWPAVMAAGGVLVFALQAGFFFMLGRRSVRRTQEIAPEPQA